VRCNIARTRFCRALASNIQEDGPDATKGLVSLTLRHPVFKAQVTGRCVVYRSGRKSHVLEWCPWCAERLGVYRPRGVDGAVAKLERTSVPAEPVTEAELAPQEGPAT